MISSAFKSAETSRVQAGLKTGANVQAGVKEIGNDIMMAMGIPTGGNIASTALKFGLQNSNINGIGGQAMVSTMSEKAETAKVNNLSLSQIEGVTRTIVGDSPINRRAQKDLDTVFNVLKLMNQREGGSENGINNQ